MYSYQCVLKFMKASEKKEDKRIIKEYLSCCQLSFARINTIKGPLKKYFFLSKINFYLCCKFSAVFGLGF